MKRLSLIILPLLLIVGCSKPINEETLIEKDRLKYHPETKELYSGEVFSLHIGGKKEFEGSYKDGKLDGLQTRWYKNGQKESERTYKDGKIDGLWTRWYSNGQKEIEGTLKDGEHDGLLTYWDQNGQKRKEETYKDGELDKLVTKWWNKDGSVDQFGQSGDSLRFDELI